MRTRVLSMVVVVGIANVAQPACRSGVSGRVGPDASSDGGHAGNASVQCSEPFACGEPDEVLNGTTDELGEAQVQFANGAQVRAIVTTMESGSALQGADVVFVRDGEYFLAFADHPDTYPTVGWGHASQLERVNPWLIPLVTISVAVAGAALYAAVLEWQMLTRYEPPQRIVRLGQSCRCLDKPQYLRLRAVFDRGEDLFLSSIVGAVAPEPGASAVSLASSTASDVQVAAHADQAWDGYSPDTGLVVCVASVVPPVITVDTSSPCRDGSGDDAIGGAGGTAGGTGVGGSAGLEGWGGAAGECADRWFRDETSGECLAIYAGTMTLCTQACSDLLCIDGGCIDGPVLFQVDGEGNVTLPTEGETAGMTVVSTTSRDGDTFTITRDLTMSALGMATTEVYSGTVADESIEGQFQSEGGDATTTTVQTGEYVAPRIHTASDGVCDTVEPEHDIDCLDTGAGGAGS